MSKSLVRIGERLFTGVSSRPVVSAHPPHAQGFTVWEQLVALYLPSAY